MSNQPVDQSRRTWVTMACAAGGVGGVATVVPFVSTFQPSERARAAGAAVEADVSTLKPGEMMTVEWRGKPVWIIKRTPEQLAGMKKIEGQLADPNSERKLEMTPEYARNDHRSIKPDLMVAVGICTHLGCSTFDLAGRVFKNKPAPDNLEVPPHMFLSETKLLIGEDKKA
jgi:ubiquinol-cytochrome c reductase iron-sulfur subunit